MAGSLPQKYEEEIRLSGCDCRVDIQEPEIVGDWDPVRLEQALTNLFLNALRYAEGEKVTLSVAKNEKQAMFRVINSGGGIEGELQKEIFEPFKRGNADSSNKGLGVGLFIARQIAIAHGGDIKVKSKPGSGSTFTLQLPLS